MDPMKKYVIGGVVLAVVFIIVVVMIAIFGDARKAPVAMPSPTAAPQATPQRIALPFLPIFDFFRRAPTETPDITPTPTAAGIPEGSPVIVIPSPPIFGAQLPASFERKIAEIKAQGRTDISAQELFDLQWPVEYREKLAYVQDLMINQGVIPQSERKSFNSQSEILEFLAASLDFATKIGVMTQTDALRYTEALNTVLPTEKQREEDAIRARLQGAQSGSLLKLWTSTQQLQSSGPTKNDLMTLTKAVTELFRQYFYPKTASGQISIDCWQEITYTPNVIGPSLWAPCCNCFGSKIPIGCLNFVCAGKSAIWDSITGICGCDF